MIVKDEALLLAESLAQVRPFIDAWCIVDTGSSDDTAAIAQKSMGGLPGKLHRRSWVGFAHNRSECFELARAAGDYALVLDADDRWTPGDGFAWPTDNADGYYVRSVMSGTRWDRLLLLRCALPWRYEGVVHEVPKLERLEAPVLGRLRDVHVNADSKGNRRLKDPISKYVRDAQDLEAHLQQNPDDARSVFYCAQSYRDAGDHLAALRLYKRRASMGGWKEEVWYSHYQAGLIQGRSGQVDEALASFLRAYDADPERAENLVAAASLARRKDLPHVAYSAATAATRLPEPERLLLLEPSAYRWRAHDECALAAFYTGRFAEALDRNRRLLHSVPPSEVPRIQKNIE